LGAAIALAVPQVLIHQTKVVVKTGDPNVPLADYLASELSASARLSPIVLSMTDPVFRTAVLEGKLKDVPDEPNLDQVMAAARQLQVEYVMSCQAAREGSKVRAIGQLFRNGRSVWKDQQLANVAKGGQNDEENTARSIARTWNIKINAGPLKDKVEQPAAATPEAAPGQAPRTPDLPVIKAPTVDAATLKAQIEAQVTAGQPEEALLIARDAVDESPLDLDRRMLLVRLLQSTGKDELAAGEARRAAELMPDKVGLRVLAARAWMSIGNLDEAQAELNEAIARDPNGAETRLLLGEMSLIRLQPEKALEHLSAAIKEEPSRDAYFLRALCRGLLGGGEGAKADLAQTEKAPATASRDSVQQYALAATVLDQATTQAANSVRSLIQRAAVRPKDKEVRDQLELLQQGVQAKVAFLTAVQVPANHKGSHNRSVLAQKLLAQTLLDLQGYIDAGGEDAITDARINLGEALKQVSAAREAFAAERVGSVPKKPG
jgi:tetratricopeptide (TPR) repeat protein